MDDVGNIEFLVSGYLISYEYEFISKRVSLDTNYNLNRMLSELIPESLVNCLELDARDIE